MRTLAAVCRPLSGGNIFLRIARCDMLGKLGDIVGFRHAFAVVGIKAVKIARRVKYIHHGAQYLAGLV